MTIRPALPADAAGIAAIWNPVIRDTLITFNAREKTEADLRAMIAERAEAGHGFWVAQTGGEILGFATYSQFRGGIGYAHTMEHTVMLAPGVQGAGLGRALMHSLETHARENQVHSIFAGVSSANSGGIRFHARLGYVEVAVLAQVGWKSGQWLDLHLMQKML